MSDIKQHPSKWWDNSEKETAYLHWTRNEPATQIQLAFRNHWTLFQEIISKRQLQGNKCIELGCGRGTMSMYFADAGWDCTLVDLSQTVLDTAKKAFSVSGLEATFIEGDATDTKQDEGTYDVCVSIGLLEHIPDLEKALAEQVRLLRKGGVLLAYIVPENNPQAQQGWDWLNDILKMYWRHAGGVDSFAEKPDVYRSDADSNVYLDLLSKMPLENVETSGVYSLPMLSPSIDFPFTLNAPDVEARLTEHFQDVLEKRKQDSGNHPWLCAEEFGQAFLVWGWKE